MEVIEREKGTVKEVPANYWCDRYCGDGYGTPFASKGVAGAGLGLGIAGTALGLLALGRHGGIGLFGNNAPENVNINANMGAGGHGTAPTAFQAEGRCCAGNRIVNYVNPTFVPQTIAEPTVGTTTHTEGIFVGVVALAAIMAGSFKDNGGWQYPPFIP